MVKKNPRGDATNVFFLQTKEEKEKKKKPGSNHQKPRPGGERGGTQRPPALHRENDLPGVALKRPL